MIKNINKNYNSKQCYENNTDYNLKSGFISCMENWRLMALRGWVYRSRAFYLTDTPHSIINPYAFHTTVLKSILLNNKWAAARAVIWDVMNDWWCLNSSAVRWRCSRATYWLVRSACIRWDAVWHISTSHLVNNLRLTLH